LGTGDAKHWEVEFAVESPLTPEALLAHIRKQAEQDRALEVSTLSDARQLAWQYRSEFGGRWRLTFEARDGEAANRYQLIGKLAALD
jgi:hypothetical protein